MHTVSKDMQGNKVAFLTVKTSLLFGNAACTLCKRTNKQSNCPRSGNATPSFTSRVSSVYVASLVTGLVTDPVYDTGLVTDPVYDTGLVTDPWPKRFVLLLVLIQLVSPYCVGPKKDLNLAQIYVILRTPIFRMEEAITAIINIYLVFWEMSTL